MWKKKTKLFHLWRSYQLIFDFCTKEKNDELYEIYFSDQIYIYIAKGILAEWLTKLLNRTLIDLINWVKWFDS